jgi:hypothetical protein
MAIYDLPGFINMSLDSAATPANIKAGFLATGIYPYNRDVFGDEELLSSCVTDRLAPATDSATLNYSDGNIKHDKSAGAGPSIIHSPEPGSSKRTPAETNPSSSMSLTPERVRTFPKATGRKGTANATRKKRGTAILTYKPVKAALQTSGNRNKWQKEKHIRRGAGRASLITLQGILR